MKRAILFLFTTIIIVLLLIYNIFLYNEPNGFTIMLDPGHGGALSADKGAHKDGIDESDLNDEVTKMLAKKLKRKGYKVIYSRKPYKDEEEVSLENRTKIANKKKPNLFVSIHHDSGESKSRGYTVYYSTYKHNLDNQDVYMTYGKEKYPFIGEKNEDGETVFSYEKDGEIVSNKGISEHIVKDYSPCKEAENGKKAAEKIGENLSKLKYISPLKPNNSVAINDFRVLRDTNAPSILIECGFMSNKDELKEIQDRHNQDNLTDKILDGIDEYFKVRK